MNNSEQERGWTGSAGDPSFTGPLILALAVCVGLSLVPGHWTMPETGLDPSWRYAAEYAYLNGLVFGRDFDFTAGPLSFVYTRQFHTATMSWVILSTLHGVCVFVAAVWWSANRFLFLIALVCFAASFAPLQPDALFFTVALAVFLLILSDARPIFVQLLVAGLAIPALAKFNILVASLPLLILADATIIARLRKLRGYTATFIGCFIILHSVSGQPIGVLWDFLYGAFDGAVGYGQTMGNFWWTSEHTALVTLLIAFLVVASGLTFTGRNMLVSISCSLAFLWLGFISFKTGSVRSGHIFTTWTTLAAIVCFVSFMPSRLPYARRLFLAWSIVGTTIVFVFSNGLTLNSQAAEVMQRRIATLQRQWTRSVAWLRPVRRIESLKEERTKAESRLAANVPANLLGSVASVPWDFSEILAAKYRFAPTPPLQQYTNYTPRLRKLSEEFFKAAARPENLFFRLASIDGRYVSSELGLSLPLIIAGYDVVQLGSPLPGSPLQLVRRNTPRSITTKLLEDKWVGVNEWISVPAPTEGALLLSIRPVERLRGKVLALLYKQSSFDLDLRFADGAISTSRFYPNLVADGFLVIPPDLSEPTLFSQAANGLNLAQANPLVAVRVRPADAAAAAFLPTFGLVARAVSMSGKPEIRLPSDAMQALIAGRVIESPSVRLFDKRLLAHAPSKIAVMMPTGARLTGELGFFDGAWQEGDPQAVTFSISALMGNQRQTLFERTLDPKKQPADRGPKEFSVTVPQAPTGDDSIELIFQTAPSTSWGWTYWSNLKFDR